MLVLARAHRALAAFHADGVDQADQRLDIVRLKFQRGLEMLHGGRRRGQREVVHRKSTARDQFPHALGVRVRRVAFGQQRVSHRARDFVGDFVLQRKESAHWPVVGARPDVFLGFRVDELCKHADGISGMLDAAFEHDIHVQTFGNLADARLAVSKRERGSARNDLEFGESVSM